MADTVTCPECRKSVNIPAAPAGTHMHCPHCRTELGVVRAAKPIGGCLPGGFATLTMVFVVLGIQPDVSSESRAGGVLGLALLVLLFVSGMLISGWAGGRGRTRRSSLIGFLSGGAMIGTAIGLFLLILSPAVSGDRVAARRTQCRNNIHQLAIALANYEEVHGTFPPAVTYGPDGRAMHGWGVNLLPYIEEAPLYREYDHTKPWDHPDNAEVVSTYLEQYECPLAHGSGPENSTYYRLVVCPGSVIRPRRAAKSADITDKPGQTILIVECIEPVPWASPNAVVDLTRGINRPGGASSKHKKGVYVAMADSQVLFLSEDIDHMTLIGLCTAAGGETIDESQY